MKSSSRRIKSFRVLMTRLKTSLVQNDRTSWLGNPCHLFLIILLLLCFLLKVLVHNVGRGIFRYSGYDLNYVTKVWIVFSKSPNFIRCLNKVSNGFNESLWCKFRVLIVYKDEVPTCMSFAFGSCVEPSSSRFSLI